MGYDFMFMKAKSASRVSFPCGVQDLDYELGTFPWGKLHDELLRRGASGEETLELDLAGHGQIWFTGDDDSAHLDVHARWEPVLELFRWLRRLDPAVVLFDMSLGVYHDPESFELLVSRSQLL